MNWKRSLLVLVAIASVSLTSCSGLSDICTTNCTSNGNASVTLTMFDTPPAGATVLSFNLPIVGISLTPQSGSPVSVYSPSSAQPFEITRLQTDSALVATAVTVPAGSYTALNVTIGATSGIWINASASTVGGCVSGGVCVLPAGTATTVTVPINLTLNGNQSQWIGLNVNLNNAITTANGIGVDFTQASVFTATMASRTGLPSGAADIVEDFTGKVTSLSNNSITVQNAVTAQSVTATVTSSTELDVAPGSYSNCTSANPSTCIASGSIVSLDATVAPNGTLTATEIDALDVNAVDEVEGVIYPTSNNTPGVFGLILLDKTSASGNSVLSNATFGTPFLITATNNNVTYTVDTKTLTTPVGTNPSGFSSSSDLFAGQVVRVQVSNVNVSNNTNTATGVNVLLRWSHITALVNSAAGTAFFVNTLPAYINALNSTLSLTPQVNTYANYTNFDGLTSAGDLAVGEQVGFRALYVNPQTSLYPFLAAKVRVP